MKHKYLKDVVSLSLNLEKCVGCGRCTEVCPRAVFEIVEKRTQLIDRDSCIECGACSVNCPKGAIEVSAGTGCAAAIIFGWIMGSEPSCDGGSDNNGGCC